MLPATIFIGATLPLSVRVLARDETEATAGTARIYAWNTVGAIVGAILAGFVLIPGLGFEGSIRVAVGVNLFLALWAAACVARAQADPGGHRRCRPRRDARVLQPVPPPGGSGKLRFHRRLSRSAAGTVLRRRALLHRDAAGFGQQLLRAHQRPSGGLDNGQRRAAEPGHAEVADRAAGGRAPGHPQHARGRLRRRRGAGGRTAFGGERGRGRTRTGGDRREPPGLGHARRRSAVGPARQCRDQRRPQRPQADRQHVRRDRLPTLASVDGPVRRTCSRASSRPRSEATSTTAASSCSG